MDSVDVDRSTRSNYVFYSIVNTCFFQKRGKMTEFVIS